MDPTGLGSLIINLGVLAALVLNLRRLSGASEARRIIPDPLRVSGTDCDLRHREVDRRLAAVEAATEKVMAAASEEISEAIRNLKDDISGLRQLQVEGARGTHQRLNALVDVVAQQGREISELKGRLR